MKVKPKKSLGQHFLANREIARRISDALLVADGTVMNVLEVGCGTGALTQHLLQRSDILLKGIEIDGESIAYLRENLPAIMPRLYEADFLKSDLRKIFPEGDFCVIGNFPYNISSQI
ncbi:MAG: methyltransferase domain-containing protein, partial [Bacteroidales bacterium]|nr:methyltransferase domain-containing protein [Bacteroidales bacterium]